MRLPLIVRPLAQSDIQQAYDFLESGRSGLGVRFRDELALVFERIESSPEMYGRIRNDVRAGRVKKFRYIVYYTVHEDRVEVLAVIHGSRHESSWQSRLLP